MIRFTPLPPGVGGHLRWDKADAGQAMPTFHAVCTVVWRNLNEVYLTGLQGELSRRDWRELLQWLHEREIHRVVCQRAPGHLVPFATPAGNGWLLVDVGQAWQRYGMPSADGQ